MRTYTQPRATAANLMACKRFSSPSTAAVLSHCLVCPWQCHLTRIAQTEHARRRPATQEHCWRGLCLHFFVSSLYNQKSWRKKTRSGHCSEQKSYCTSNPSMWSDVKHDVMRGIRTSFLCFRPTVTLRARHEHSCGRLNRHRREEQYFTSIQPTSAQPGMTLSVTLLRCCSCSVSYFCHVVDIIIPGINLGQSTSITAHYEHVRCRPVSQTN